MPRWIARACDITLGRLLVSSSPVDGPMGATLELQRQEQMERLEQQMLLQRSRDARRQNIGQGYAERLVGPEAMWGDHLVNGARRQRVNAFNPMSNALSLSSISCLTHYFSPVNRPQEEAPSEENVNFLTGMGFSRERVVRALQTTGNNVEAATNLLLQDP
jgi:UBA/TS-N domain